MNSIDDPSVQCLEQTVSMNGNTLNVKDTKQAEEGSVGSAAAQGWLSPSDAQVSSSLVAFVVAVTMRAGAVCVLLIAANTRDAG